MSPSITLTRPFRTKHTTETNYEGITASGKPIVVTAEKREVVDDIGPEFPLYGVPVHPAFRSGQTDHAHSHTHGHGHDDHDHDHYHPQSPHAVQSPAAVASQVQSAATRTRYLSFSPTQQASSIGGMPGNVEKPLPGPPGSANPGAGAAMVTLGPILEAEEGSMGQAEERLEEDEDNMDVTPSARAKVLPWVTEMQASHISPESAPATHKDTDNEPVSAAALAHANHEYARQSWIEQEEAERNRIAVADADSDRRARGVSVFDAEGDVGGDATGHGGRGTGGPSSGPAGKSLKSDAMSRGAAVPGGATVGGQADSNGGIGVDDLGQPRSFLQGLSNAPQPMAFGYSFAAGAPWGQQAGLRQGAGSGQPPYIPGQPGFFMSSPYGHPPFLPGAQTHQAAGVVQPPQGFDPNATGQALPTATQMGPADVAPAASVSMFGQAGSTPVMNADTAPGATTSPTRTSGPFPVSYPVLTSMPTAVPAGGPVTANIPVMMPQQPMPLGVQMGMFGAVPPNIYPTSVVPTTSDPHHLEGSRDKGTPAVASISPTKAAAQAIIDADVNAWKLAQAKLFENAANSYAALEREQQAREAERQKTLAQLAGLGSHQQSAEKVAVNEQRRKETSSGYDTESTSSGERRRRKKEKKAKRDQSRSKRRRHERREKEREHQITEDIASPRYIPTTEGHVKSHEFLHFADDLNPQPKRSTQDTQPTTTSGPSFGHFGRPFSHQAGVGAAGVPIVIVESATGPSFGFGTDLGVLGLSLADIMADTPREKLSAYVETVPDEEDLPGRLRSSTSSSYNVRDAASHLPQAVERSVQERANMYSAKGSAASIQGSPVTQHTLIGHAREAPLAAAPSLSGYSNLTTMSLVNQLVSDSRFHDDALCEILAAAQNEQLGEAARRTLRRAAKERVLHLMGNEEQGLSGDATPRPKGARIVSQSSATSRGSEPPDWSRAMFDMLAETQGRLDRLGLAKSTKHSHAGPTGATHAHDEEQEAAARAALHNLLFPDIPVDVPHPRELPHSAPASVRTGNEFAEPVPMYRNGPTAWRVGAAGAGFPFVPMVPIPAGPPIIQVQPPTVPNTDYAASRSHGTRVPLAGTEALHIHEATAQAPRETAVERGRSEPPVELAEEQRGLPNVEIGYPRPWDIATQRLYSWALVWPANEFKRALERTALGYQVEDFALTIYTMMIFKRNLRHRMCAIPPLPCDKLFVPPNIADAINRAVHAKRFNDARQMLEELWYPFGFTTPPRVIVALAKHRNDPDHWAAHRFDLPTARLVTMSFSNDTKSLLDGRPFMWWFAIREAWPEHEIPHPDHLAQKTHRIVTMQESKDANSLAATNAARNFLLGWRPERETDLKKLRENIWQEVKRLYNRKIAGRLIIDPGHEGAEDF